MDQIAKCRIEGGANRNRLNKKRFSCLCPNVVDLITVNRLSCDVEGLSRDKLDKYIHECIKRFSEDNQGLLKKFPESLNQTFFRSICNCRNDGARQEISKLINIWKDSGIYSESYARFLHQEFKRAEEEVPAEKERIMSTKVKFFALYYKYFADCKIRCSEYEDKINQKVKIIEAGKNEGDTTLKELDELVKKYQLTLISLKYNRRNLLKSVVDLAKDFKQSISLRLHKIQEIEKLKEQVLKFIDPEESKI